MSLLKEMLWWSEVIPQDQNIYNLYHVTLDGDLIGHKEKSYWPTSLCKVSAWAAWNRSPGTNIDTLLSFWFVQTGHMTSLLGSDWSRIRFHDHESWSMSVFCYQGPGQRFWPRDCSCWNIQLSILEINFLTGSNCINLLNCRFSYLKMLFDCLANYRIRNNDKGQNRN